MMAYHEVLTLKSIGNKTSVICMIERQVVQFFLKMNCSINMLLYLKILIQD